jgi:hypothetical protein
MKEDYLWDKTGEDAELERLENALKAFRFQEHAPPELPQKVLTIAPEKPRRFFQLRFALAAFAAVLVILSLVWLQSGKIPTDRTVAENNAPKRPEKVANESFIPPAQTPAVKNPEVPPAVKPNVVRIRQTNAPAVRRNKPSVSHKRAKEPVETLTAEERYAYDQLMLALSITGSKLRLVKDAVDGIEGRNAVLDPAK